MSVDVQVLAAIAGAVASLVGGFWLVLQMGGRQFEKRLDERFAAQEALRTEGRKSYETRLGKIETEYNELHRAFLRHLAELPRDYMRREDHIRFETVINAKLDALAAKQDLLAERLPLRRD